MNKLVTVEYCDDADMLNAVLHENSGSKPWQLAGDIGPLDKGRLVETIRQVFPDVFFLLVRVGSKPSGLFMFLKNKDGNWEVHTELGQDCRGRKAAIACLWAEAIFFSRVQTDRLTTYCPVGIPESLVMALHVGFKVMNRTNESVYCELLKENVCQ